jgi:ketosteroid isomerase-like protein
MSEENVEIVRRLAKGFQRGDYEDAFNFYDLDIEWDARRLREISPDFAGVHRGHDGVRSFWRRWLSAWRDLEFEVEDVRAAGDDVLLLIRDQRQWGRHSGIETKVPPYTMAFSFRRGKVVRVRYYPDHESALEAAGLRE